MDSQPGSFPAPPKEASIAKYSAYPELPTSTKITINDLPRLQVENASSPSKPDNYRISPMTPISTNSAYVTSIWDDWSGRGSHVDFGPHEKIPLEQGRFLGHGVMGGVYETECKGVAVAWKKRYCRKKIGEAEMREISILKKLSHHHIIQLVGTYTQPSGRAQFLGLLLWPVAVCDLATFFEDWEAVHDGDRTVEEDRSSRFAALGLPPTAFSDYDSLLHDQFLNSKFGCLAKAIEYLHSQKIRHKDLKPSNILLAMDKLWLTDFGSSTDFSMLSMSATENGERGTPKYFAPEVAAYEPNGRAADIFSLGCIFLEMLKLLHDGSLENLRVLRSGKDGSFQANLQESQTWLGTISSHLVDDQHLICEIKAMLSREPDMRPSAADVTKRLAHINQFQNENAHSLFGNCCETSYIATQEHEKASKLLEDQVASLQVEQRLTQVQLQTALKEIEHLQSKLSAALSQSELLNHQTIDHKLREVDKSIKLEYRKVGETGQSLNSERVRALDGHGKALKNFQKTASQLRKSEEKLRLTGNLDSPSNILH